MRIPVNAECSVCGGKERLVYLESFLRVYCQACADKPAEDGA